MAADLPGAPPPALLCRLFFVQMCRLSSMCYDVLEKVFFSLGKTQLFWGGKKAKHLLFFEVFVKLKDEHRFFI